MTTDARRYDRAEIGRDPESQRALEEAIKAGHETDVVSKRVVLIAAALIVALATIGWTAVYFLEPLFTYLQEEKYPPPNPLAATQGRIEPPAPRLQVDPALDIYEFRAAQERLLTTYGWVDEQAGVVRIPIARAIDLLAERGLPAVSASASQPAPAAAQPEVAPAEPTGAVGPIGETGEGDEVPAAEPEPEPAEEAR